MPIRIVCPHCRDSYAVDDAMLGKRARCHSCKEVLTVQPARHRADDDDEPRPERRVAERPAPRVVYRNEEDEPEQPRASRRDEGPPQRPRRKKAKSGGTSPWVYIGGGVVVSLLVAVVVWLSWLTRDKTPSLPGTDQTQLKPLPGPQPAGLPAALGADDLRRVKNATVYLRVNLPTGGIAEGTGFFAIEPGIVVTNAHVLGMLNHDSPPPRQVAVVLNSGEASELSLGSQVLGVDRENDLAVLRVAAPRGLALPVPLRLGEAGGLIETQKVYIFGFPLGAQLGKNITVSESSVSSLRREGGMLSQLQVNGGMHPGNSGGPVTDSRGLVVGVSVAVIRNTQINFAIPAEIVQQVMEGAPGELSVGTPFTRVGHHFVQLSMTALDPLGKVREVKFDVWAGNRGPARPGSVLAPLAQPGDGPRATYNASAQRGVFLANASMPELGENQVLWAQPQIIRASGTTRYGTAMPFELVRGLSVDRTDVRLSYKAPDRLTRRTLRMKNNQSITIFRGRESLTASQKMDGYVLESLAPDKRGLGTGVRLTLGQPTFTREIQGRKSEAPESIRTYLSRFSPTFLVNAKNEAKERGNRDFRDVPMDIRETVEELFETVCNNWEMTTLPLPNRVVEPGDTWSAQVPMLVKVDDTWQVQVLHVTCSYEGTCTVAGRNMAYVRLAGVVKPREGRGNADLGRVTGHVLVDVEKGYLSFTRVTISTEVDTGSNEFRMVLTNETILTREDGNSQGIKVAGK